MYDLPERVLPPAVLALPVPTEAEAQIRLLDIAGRALGIMTATDLRDYFRLGPDETRAALAVLVETGRLQPVSVEGWDRPGYLHVEARIPRRIDATALLAPFDPMVWERSRTERIFGFRYRIEIYVPADKRQYGYYVLPFLLGDRLVARVDLKADRLNLRLLVRAVHYEIPISAGTLEALEGELALLSPHGSVLKRWFGQHPLSALAFCDRPASLPAPLTIRRISG